MSINKDIWEVWILRKNRQAIIFSWRHWNRKYLIPAHNKAFNDLQMTRKKKVLSY